jgi:uncharacterized protein YlbG (UPF0298 family)
MRDTQTLHDKAHRAIDLALTNLILSKVPAAFNNSFVLKDNSVDIDQKGGIYRFTITYFPAPKVPKNLKDYCIVVYVSTHDEKYCISLVDPNEGDQILQETVNSHDDLVGTYYKWVASEFGKL